jgi:uncharacterized protein (TIGR02284 family)
MNHSPAKYLNKLLQTNLDRLACYEHAVQKLQGSALTVGASPFFLQLSHECAAHIREIRQLVKKTARPENAVSFRCKITLWWMDILQIISAKPAMSILACCEWNDRQSLMLYDKVLAMDINVSGSFRQRLLDHKLSIEAAINLLCTYRTIQNAYIATDHKHLNIQ